jgi:Zn-dependent protease
MLTSAWPVPFILTPQTLEIDAIVSFCVSVLLATMVNAEAQAFASTFMGDSRIGARDRFNFNVFLHLDILGTMCYLVGGFGWPRQLDVDTSKFKHPRVYLVITRTVGPLANLMLASIAGSLAMVMMKYEYDPRVFLMVVGVNITTAIYNLIILPPLAAGVAVGELLPEGPRYWFLLAGPCLLLALALVERLSSQGIVGPYLNPMVMAVYHYLGG